MEVGLAHWLELVEGCARRARLAFQGHYGSEAGGIEALVRPRWPQGHVRTRLRKWFLAPWWRARDEIAWLMAHNSHQA